MTTTIEPPADAVAKDAHWAKTVERLRNRNRPIAKLTICDDEVVKEALGEAQYEDRQAKRLLEADPSDANLKKRAAAAARAVSKAQAAFDEEAIVLRFQALERPVFEALKKEHPASEVQSDDGLEYDVETLGPKLIAQSSLDGITEEDAAHYLNTWAEGEAAQLFQTAWDVQQVTRLDVGKG
ncbi:hypothetical protein ACWY4P_53975 (plasmid) [Streptomyces sp. LZ34]